MPLYNKAAPSSTAIYPGDEVTLFNNETVAALQNSIEVAVAPTPGSAPQFALSTAFTVAPTAVIDVQAANDDNDASYVNIATTSTNKLVDLISFTTNAQFIRLIITSYAAGGKLTAKLSRMA